jgi:TonB family protein
MSSHSNIWGKPEQFDVYIKKFRSLFDMHTIQFGSPEDFPGFMTKLVQDRHFAMDFWALTGTLSRREGGELSVEQVLAVIVHGVTGGDIPADDDGHKTLVDELATLLAGVDLYSPSRFSDGETVVPPPVSPITHAVAQAGSADVTNRAVGEVPLTSSAPASAFIAGAVESEPDQSSSPVATVQHQLDEALMRLELNSLELKEHLDDLDKKMSRIEPHLEALTSKMNSTQRLRRPAEEPIDKAFKGAVRKPAENPRLVLEPREKPLTDKPDDSSIRTPLAGYFQRSGHRGLVLFVAIFAMLLVGGVVLQQRYGSSLWQRYGVTVREEMHGSDTGQIAANPASQNAAPNTVAELSSTAASSSDRGNSVNPPTTSGASIPSASTAGPSRASGQTMAGQAVVSDAQQAVGDRSYARSGRKTTHSSPTETVGKASDGNEAGAIRVAPAVMEANLVASRVPAYPEGAKADHIEGPVVVQAIISKDGFVDRVHVIQGNPRLRNAAAEAVQKWRYKPYLLNGQPVEVATTITVDFTLDDW